MQDKGLLSKCLSAATELTKRKREFVEADAEVGITYKDSLMRNELASKQLERIKPTLKHLEVRKGICREGEEVAFLLPYNMGVVAYSYIAPQLAVGNKVRIKPSELTVRLGKIMESIWHDISPENVTFDFTPGPKFMKWAIREPKIKAIIFIGSHRVALDYMDDIKAAKKKFIFEGPGKNPFIVLEDADIKKAADGLYISRFMGAGQICASPGIMYVHSKVFDKFMNNFIKATKKLVVGDPKDPRTDIGPLGSELAVARIKEHLQDAELKGGKIIHGGKIEGNLVYPTIIVNTNESMKGLQEESFGPICWFKTFDSVKEVIELARDNKFGLQMQVYGGRGVEKIIAELKGEDYLHEVKDFVFGKYGMVLVNSDLPEMLRRQMTAVNQKFGGYGYSGWVWETINDKFTLKQGPKDFAIETSIKSYSASSSFCGVNESSR